MSKFFFYLWLMVLILVFSYFALTFRFLPDHLAVHFDGAGRPNGFQEKGGYGTTFPLFVMAVNGLFVFTVFFLDRVPEGLIHFPGKELWFSSPELKSAALEKIQNVLFLTASFSNTAFLFAVQVIYQENAPDPLFKISMNAGMAFILLGSGFLCWILFYLMRPPIPEDKPQLP